MLQDTNKIKFNLVQRCVLYVGLIYQRFQSCPLVSYLSIAQTLSNGLAVGSMCSYKEVVLIV